jgi:hypothetical protein
VQVQVQVQVRVPKLAQERGSLLIRTLAWGHPLQYWRATCSCGWQGHKRGPAYSARLRAVKEMEEHLRHVGASPAA